MKPLSAEDLRRLEEIYTAAMERPSAERRDFVAATCADDPQLLRRLDRMIIDAEGAALFMEKPTAAHDEQCEQGDDPLIGCNVGRYVLLRVIGIGGMGVVYAAQQDSPRRTIALKLLRPGWMSRSLLRRFEHEAEVLGRLSHPGIAQIYESGTVDVGTVHQPFFAMEYVEGRPITAFAADQRLSARQRQELMASVCDAVEHAHQKGVIHRDLKPGNVLVNGAGQPKVLDFGVARATNADIAATTLQTHEGQIVGTIAYMSPEQARGSAADLDTRSDVYSLGVMLFELLAGRLPHDVANKSIPEAVRALTEDDPSHLSTSDRSLRGDVETIVAKALEKDKTRRYQSAAELAADLRRLLNDEPIAARPASSMYQLSKFAKRNKGLVGGVVAAFVVLVGALVGVSIQAARIERAKVSAEEAAWFMESVLSASDPYPSIQGSNLPKYFGANAHLIDVLDEALHQLDDRQLRDPRAEATIRQKMSMSFFGVGRFKDGAHNASRALEILSDSADDDPLVIASKIGLAYNLLMLMEDDEAERVALEAAHGAVMHYGECHEATLRALHALWLCHLYRGYLADCESVSERMLAIVDASARSLDYPTFSIKAELAAVLIGTRRVLEGQRLAEDALAEGLAGGYDRTHWVAYNRLALGNASAQRGVFVEAEEQSRLAFQIWEAAAGETGALEFKVELGQYISAQDHRRDEGLALIREAVASSRKPPGADSPTIARLLYALACRLFECGLVDEAETAFLEYFEIVERARCKVTHLRATAAYGFAMVLVAQARGAADEEQKLLKQNRTDEARERRQHADAKWAAAEERLRIGIRIAEQFTRVQWARHWWDDRLLHSSLAALLHERGRDSEAAPLIARIAERSDEPCDPWHADTVAWRMFELGRPDLCELIAAQGVNDWRRLRKQGEGPYTYGFVNTVDSWAAALRALGRLDEAEAAWREGERAWAAEPGAVPRYSRTALRHGECLAALGRFEEAEAVYLRTIADLQGSAAPDSALLQSASTATAAMYEAWGKPEQAAQYRESVR